MRCAWLRYAQCVLRHPGKAFLQAVTVPCCATSDPQAGQGDGSLQFGCSLLAACWASGCCVVYAADCASPQSARSCHLPELSQYVPMHVDWASCSSAILHVCTPSTSLLSCSCKQQQQRQQQQTLVVPSEHMVMAVRESMTSPGTPHQPLHNIRCNGSSCSTVQGHAHLRLHTAAKPLFSCALAWPATPLCAAGTAQMQNPICTLNHIHMHACRTAETWLCIMYTAHT